MSGVTPSATATIDLHGQVGVVTMRAPPLNILSHRVRQALLGTILAADAMPQVRVIVLICEGRSFFAGADIAEFGAPMQPPELAQIAAALECTRSPVVVAIHGTALGGGLEVALACHYRVASASAMLGLPEITLGLMPGAGGTQRLPRLIGAAAALEMIVSGLPVAASRALDLGLLDAVLGDDTLLTDAIGFAETTLLRAAPFPRARDRVPLPTDAAELARSVDAFSAKHARLIQTSPAASSCIIAVRAAFDRPFDAGLTLEAELFEVLYTSPQAAALRYLFLAQRRAATIPGLPKNLTRRPIARVGVIGAGTMGGGIAMNFLNVGLPVTIVETAAPALQRGLATIRRNYDSSARRGALQAADVEHRMSLLTGALDLDAIAECDLIIEAVYEDLAVKQQVFARLDSLAKPGAILASNTSFLDIDRIAAATSRPGSVVGLHFFSPANVMALLEVVRGAATADDVLATVMALAKHIGKAPVLSGVCDGFIANRAMAARWRQADRLILQGIAPSEVDRVLVEYGFTMGHFAMMDLVGLDVIGRTATERSVMSELVAAGRLGQKSGGGYYGYDEKRRPLPSAVATRIIRSFGTAHDQPDQAPNDQTILERLLYPVINEAARILQEGIASRPSDIDVALVTGYGWPAPTGGPLFWADTIGVDHVADRLISFRDRFGPEFEPCRFLQDMASTHQRFAQLLADI